MIVKNFRLKTEDLTDLKAEELYDLCLIMYDGIFTYLKDVYMSHSLKGQRQVSQCQKKLFKRIDKRGHVKSFMKRKTKHKVLKIVGLNYVFMNPQKSFVMDEIKWEIHDFTRVGPIVMLKLASSVIKSAMQCLEEVGNTSATLADEINDIHQGIDRVFEKFYCLLSLATGAEEYPVQRTTTFLSTLLKIERDEKNT